MDDADNHDDEECLSHADELTDRQPTTHEAEREQALEDLAETSRDTRGDPR